MTAIESRKSPRLRGNNKTSLLVQGSKLRGMDGYISAYLPRTVTDTCGECQQGPQGGGTLYDDADRLYRCTYLILCGTLFWTGGRRGTRLRRVSTAEWGPGRCCCSVSVHCGRDFNPRLAALVGHSSRDEQYVFILLKGCPSCCHPYCEHKLRPGRQGLGALPCTA